MKFSTLLHKKFRRRWTDVQVMIMLELGTRQATVDDLMTKTGASYNGIWNSLQMLIQVDKFVIILPNSRPLLYELSARGKTELAHFLTDGRP